MIPLILPSDPISVAEKEGPRRDYDLLAAAVGGCLLLPNRRRDLLGRVEDHTATDLRQALAAVRMRSISVYVSCSERVGIPLALLLRRRRRPIPHVLIGHHLTSARKRMLQQRVGWLNGMTRTVVLCRPQEEYLVREAGVSAERIRRLATGVDVGFWQPEAMTPEPGRILCVGRERRDYEVLYKAAALLPDRQFVVIAGSPWARGEGPVADETPQNVTVKGGGLSYREVREEYNKAAVVALPLQKGCLYAAGVNGLLEACAMGRPVVVTQTPGLSDYLEGNPAIRAVPAEDPDALAAALSAPHHAGDGRSWMQERGWTLEAYVSRLAQVVEEAIRE